MTRAREEGAISQALRRRCFGLGGSGTGLLGEEILWGRFAREGNPESAVFFFTCSGARPLREAGASDAASESRLPPPFLASLRAFVRAGALRAYVRVSRAPLACVRTVRACPRMSPPLSHARTRVCTYVRALYARAQPRGREGALSIRTYVRAHLRIRTRVPPSLSASRRVCAYVRTHAIPLGPRAKGDGVS